MSPMSAEATVVRNYIDTLINLPLEEEEQDQQLDRQRRDGAGQRPLRSGKGQGTHPLEYLAVQQRVDKVKGADPVPG